MDFNLLDSMHSDLSHFNFSHLLNLYSFDIFLACFWFVILGIGSFAFMPKITFKWQVSLIFGICGALVSGFFSGLLVGSFVWLGFYVAFIVLFIITLCVWDICEFAVPDWQNLALLALSVILALVLDFKMLSDVLMGAGLIGLCYMIGQMLFKKEILGQADIVFCGSFGGLVGFYGLVMSIFWGCVLASLIVICGRILKKKIHKIPLIPFIVAGYIAGFLAGLV